MITRTSQAGLAILGARMWLNALDSLADAPTPSGYDARAHRERERQIITGHVIDATRSLVDALEVEP